MKTIFITGASSGIGRETTKYFANHGWRVIATMRNPQKAGELADLPNVVIMPLDLMNPEQIRGNQSDSTGGVRRGCAVQQRRLRHDGGLFEKLPEDEIRKLFDTDVIGTMLVTQQFIPPLQSTQRRHDPDDYLARRHHRPAA